MRRRPRPAPSIACTRQRGGTALFTASPLQRCLSAVHAITQHFFVAPPTYEMIGKILLGVEPDGFMLGRLARRDVTATLDTGRCACCRVVDGARSDAVIPGVGTGCW